MALLAETAGVFGETARGRHGRRAARRGRARARSASPTAWSLLVTGTGLKTPQAVEAEVTGTLVEIEPDVDALLDELGVTA